MNFHTIAFAVAFGILPVAAAASCKGRFDAGVAHFNQAQDTFNQGIRLIKGVTITCDQKQSLFDLTEAAARYAARSHIAFYEATKHCSGRNRTKAERAYTQAYNLKISAYDLEDEVKAQCR